MLAVCSKKLRSITKQDLRRGCTAGVLLFFGFYIQLWGQTLTTVSHCAFLTATNVIMVPFIVWGVNRMPPLPKSFLLAGMTLAGIGILTVRPGELGGINPGDGLVLLSALFFALHIAYLSKAVEGRDVMVINLLQIGTAAVLSLAAVLLFDRRSFEGIDLAAGLPAAIYLGLFSTCLCYMLQTWAQKHTVETKTAVLLSLEGLFGTLFSVLLGMEPLTASIVVGGLVILVSVVLMGLPVGNRLGKVKESKI